MKGNINGKGTGKSSVDQLRAYFLTLNTIQKREFIQNLKQKLAGVKSQKYNGFLAECIKAYNEEVKAGDNPASAFNGGLPDISPESFAQALATMISGAQANKSTRAAANLPKLTGTWQHERDGRIFYYRFSEDGTYETNSHTGLEIIKGQYTVGIDGTILLEHHEILQISGIMLSVSGNHLTIGLTNGKSYDYKRAQ